MMTNKGLSVMLYGKGSIYESSEIISTALKNPLLDIKFNNAKGALVHVTGGDDLSLSLVNEIVEGGTSSLVKDAPVIMGARVDPELTGQIKIMTILTGVSQPIPMGPIEQLKPPKKICRKNVKMNSRKRSKKVGSPKVPKPHPLDSIPWV